MSTTHDTEAVNKKSTASKNTEESVPKQWQCGDPYEFAPPKVDGDPWEKLLMPLLEVDNARCNGWKDEVQNLLIFAGLFSGVLSAFVIQSSQSLQPNPNDAILNILTHIATRLDNPNNGTISLSLISESPPASAIRINVFWFISLVLSLTTVLIGIVCLQWLREHQNYAGSLTPKFKLALYNMRQEGLEAWHVPQIFSSLPLLLQLALVLFLVGLCDFLIPFGPAVSAPVITVIGIPILFIVLTTILPTFQAFLIARLPSKGTTRAPAQCPYKSTQSRVFRRILTFSTAGFETFLKVLRVALRAFVFLEGTLRRLSRVFRHHSGTTAEDIDEMISIGTSYHISDILTEKTWLSFDERWLTVRDTYARARLMQNNYIFSSRDGSPAIGPLYDMTMCLGLISREFSSSFLEAAHCCIDDMRLSIESHWDQHRYHQYLQTLLHCRGQLDLDKLIDLFSPRIKNPSSAIIKDEYDFLFLSRYTYGDQLMKHHFLELQTRLMNELYPKSTLAYLSGHASNTLPSYPYRRFLQYSGDKKYNKIHFPREITTQFSLTIESFFSVCTDTTITDDIFFASNHACLKFGGLLGLAIFLQADDKIQVILDIISENLIGYLDGKIQQSKKRSDMIFYAACFYTRTTLYQHWENYPWLEKQDIPAIDAFLPILRRYRSERQPDEVLRAKLGLPKFSLEGKGWWSFLGLSTLPQFENPTMIALPDVQSNDNPLDARQSYPSNALETLPSSSNTTVLDPQTRPPIPEQDSVPQLNPNAADQV